MRVNRNRTNILRAAALGAIYRAAEDDKGKGGADDKKDDKGKAEAKKIELTEQELADKLKAEREAALKSERDAQSAAKKKDDEDRERKKLEDEKKFEELATKADEKRTKAEAERDALRLDVKRRDVKDAIADYLRESHKDYAGAGVEKYILPQITFDLVTSGEEITKAVKTATDTYVKDNPRSSAAHGAPSGASRGKLGGDITIPEPSNGKEQTTQRSYTATRF